MAAIEPKARQLLTALFWCALLCTLSYLAKADDAADARGQISYVAAALTAGNANDAMTPFMKSYPDYEKLSSYFAGLTSAFQIVSEIDVTGEQDDKIQIEMTVHWALTLTDLQTNYTENRAADVNVKLVRQKGKWKIAGFEPIDLFNPAAKRAGKP